MFTDGNAENDNRRDINQSGPTNHSTLSLRDSEFTLPKKLRPFNRSVLAEFSVPRLSK